MGGGSWEVGFSSQLFEIAFLSYAHVAGFLADVRKHPWWVPSHPIHKQTVHKSPHNTTAGEWNVDEKFNQKHTKKEEGLVHKKKKKPNKGHLLSPIKPNFQLTLYKIFLKIIYQREFVGSPIKGQRNQIKQIEKKGVGVGGLGPIPYLY